MGTISLSLPSDGQTIDAADVNTPFNTIAAAINGNLDDDNIKTGANINGTKILANSIPPTAFDVNARAGWENGILAAPNTITALGNRSYSIVFNTVDYTGALSAGMRLRTTRTVAAPTQSTSLNGTTQYYNKTSPSAMTFTDDFVVSAWIKISSYAAGTVASRYNGTSGWDLQVNGFGQVVLAGFNAGAANFSQVISFQAIPLNKWVHISAQLDMSAFTAATTTSYIMMDGLDVPALVQRGGTNPTALVQAGDLQIGARNAGTQFFPGKIAQVAIYNANVTQATILASIHQTLSGSETSLISAYSFNNTINDLSANANNLTANGSAVATNADSPFGGQADGTISSTLDYAEIVSVAFSTNTTIVVRVPDGSTIPTSGGVSAVSYSTQAYPYGFPGISNTLGYAQLNSAVSTTNATATTTNLQITVTAPIGRRYRVKFFTGLGISLSGAGTSGASICLTSAADANRLVLINGTSSAALTSGATPEYVEYSTGVAKTYVAAIAASAGTASLNGNLVSPAFLQAELI